MGRSLGERLEGIYQTCKAKDKCFHLSVNDTYGMFVAYFDPAHQGLDPIPELQSNSLENLITQVEDHLNSLP